MSKDLAKRGFKFAGTTICYAFMQAVGMVNDHVVDCFRYRMLLNRDKAKRKPLHNSTHSKMDISAN
jgi:DNA-3-methyladenine glycosylase I